MEATALCTKLLTNVLLLLALQVQNCYYAEKADAAFPRIDPNRSQFFEYDSIFVNCEEFSSEWRVMRRLKEDPTNTTQWVTSTGSMTIKLAFTSDSGEYWCENEEGERSNSINITVTADDVILESPPVPVMEGDSISLYCRNRMTTSNLPADFYKDGLFSATRYEGSFPINNVSKSHEGLYKCRISGAGESAESWLAVRAHITLSPEEIQEGPETPSADGSPHLSILLSVVFTISCVAVLLLGLLHTVSGEASVADVSVVTYAVVTKQSEEKSRTRSIQLLSKTNLISRYRT